MILERFRLEGQTAVVTGAGRGIGRAIAVGLAEAGACVVVTSRTGPELEQVVAEIEGAGSRGLGVPADIRRRAEIEGVISTAVETFGSVDVLVNNAGIFQKWAPPEDVPEEEWDDVMATDLKSAFLASQLAGRYMVSRGKGSIVNIASIAGPVGLPLTVSYSAGKAAMIGMTRAMAVDWASHGVRVNAVAPGFIATPANVDLRADDEGRRDIESKTPMGRFGEVEEVAAAALFLASSAGSFVTGTVLFVDGGWVAQ